MYTYIHTHACLHVYIHPHMHICTHTLMQSYWWTHYWTVMSLWVNFLCFHTHLAFLLTDRPDGRTMSWCGWQRRGSGKLRSGDGQPTSGKGKKKGKRKRQSSTLAWL